MGICSSDLAAGGGAFSPGLGGRWPGMKPTVGPSSVWVTRREPECTRASIAEHNSSALVWSVVSGQRSEVSGQWSVVSGQWSEAGLDGGARRQRTGERGASNRRGVGRLLVLGGSKESRRRERLLLLGGRSGRCTGI